MLSPRIERTVVACLQGGTGNQLFQYAAALALAERWHADLVWVRRGAVGVSVDDLIGRSLPEATPVMVERAGLPPHYSPTVAPGRRTVLTKLNSRVRRRARVKLGRTQAIVQPSADAFSPGLPAPTKKAQALYLEGYFQNPTHFAATVPAVAEDVAKHLSDVDDLDLGRGATVVAFRRGDYIPLKWELPLVYYERALSRLPVGDGPVWAIADDPLVARFARDWLATRGVRVEPLPELGVHPVVRDLRLLIAADRVVMANSTLCWWGTTVGDHLERPTRRTVLAPSLWLPFEESSALLSDEWERVDTEL